MQTNLAHQFQGRYAVITGGTQGLGEATARLFAERGAAGLVVCGRNAERGCAVAEELSSAGCRTHFVPADLARLDDCRAVIAQADQTFGRVDALIHCAGLTDRGSILDTSPELFERMMAVNLRAPFFMLQDSARIMRREGISGTVVNIISMSSYAGQSFLCPYSVSKGALATLTRNAGFALMRDHIRVNGLNIGWMATPGEDRIQRTFHGADEGWLQKAAAEQPFGRLLQPEEVARAIAFLASEESGMMTGSVVDFDQSVIGAYDAPPQPSKRLP